MTPAQYRAKQIEMMNPFVTFFNQMQTKNRFHERQYLAVMSYQAQLDMMVIEDDANTCDCDLVKMIALEDFDDKAKQKQYLKKGDQRDLKLAQKILQQREK